MRKVPKEVTAESLGPLQLVSGGFHWFTPGSYKNIPGPSLKNVPSNDQCQGLPRYG